LLLLAAFCVPGAVLLARNDLVPGLGLLITGLVVAVMRYFLHNTLELGLQEVGGKVSSIRFKSITIESVDINEQQTRQVCKVMQRLVDAKRKRMLLSLGARSGA
jgi:hypothetical protein